METGVFATLPAEIAGSIVTRVRDPEDVRRYLANESAAEVFRANLVEMVAPEGTIVRFPLRDLRGFRRLRRLERILVVVDDEDIATFGTMVQPDTIPRRYRGGLWSTPAALAGYYAGLEMREFLLNLREIAFLVRPSLAYFIPLWLYARTSAVGGRMEERGDYRFFSPVAENLENGVRLMAAEPRHLRENFFLAWQDRRVLRSYTPAGALASTATEISFVGYPPREVTGTPIDRTYYLAEWYHQYGAELPQQAELGTAFFVYPESDIAYPHARYLINPLAYRLFAAANLGPIAIGDVEVPLASQLNFFATWYAPGNLPHLLRYLVRVGDPATITGLIEFFLVPIDRAHSIFGQPEGDVLYRFFRDRPAEEYPLDFFYLGDAPSIEEGLAVFVPTGAPSPGQATVDGGINADENLISALPA